MRKGWIVASIAVVVAVLLTGVVALRSHGTTDRVICCGTSERTSAPRGRPGEGEEGEREGAGHVGVPVSAAAQGQITRARSSCDGSARAGARMGR